MLKTSVVFLILPVIFLFAFTSAKPLNENLAEDVLKYTNQLRKAKGLPALEMRNDLNAIARKHSEDMASGRRRFGHSGLNERELKVKRIIHPYHSLAENIAYGARSGKEVVSVWKNSRVHKENMLGNYKYIGIGTATRRGVIYYTQIFVN
jgi:Uncharacterized protein with SCP/PR1 domains